MQKINISMLEFVPLRLEVGLVSTDCIFSVFSCQLNCKQPNLCLFAHFCLALRKSAVMQFNLKRSDLQLSAYLSFHSKTILSLQNPRVYEMGRLAAQLKIVDVQDQKHVRGCL